MSPFFSRVCFCSLWEAEEHFGWLEGARSWILLLFLQYCSEGRPQVCELSFQMRAALWVTGASGQCVKSSGFAL